MKDKNKLTVYKQKHPDVAITLKISVSTSSNLKNQVQSRSRGRSIEERETNRRTIMDNRKLYPFHVIFMIIMNCSGQEGLVGWLVPMLNMNRTSPLIIFACQTNRYSYFVCCNRKLSDSLIKEVGKRKSFPQHYHLHLVEEDLHTSMDLDWSYEGRRGNPPECHRRIFLYFIFCCFCSAVSGSISLTVSEQYLYKDILRVNLQKSRTW